MPESISPTPVKSEQPKSSIGSSYAGDVLVQKLYRHMTGSVKDPITEEDMPRHGLLSLQISKMGVFLYDCPSMNAIATTAFTDGVNIFMHEPLFWELVEQERGAKKKGASHKEDGPGWVIMHEASHALGEDSFRMQGFPHEVANIAKDIRINIVLPKPVPWLSENCYGFKDGDKEKYQGVSPESIGLELLRQQKQENKLDMKTGFLGDGHGHGGGRHTVTPKELATALDDAGLSDVRKKLGYPDPKALDAEEKFKQVSEDAHFRAMQNITRAAADRARFGDRYPGGDLVDAVSHQVKADNRGKLSYKLLISEFQEGDGFRTEHSMNAPGILFSVDDVTEAVGTELYLGDDVPSRGKSVALAIIDTSGSVWGSPVLKECVTEVVHLHRMTELDDDASTEVLVFSADTRVRGGVQEINTDNVQQFMQQGMDVAGGGGTDFEKPLKAILESGVLDERKVTSILYYTDGYGTPPSLDNLREAGLESGMAIYFVIIPDPHMSESELHAAQFQEAVQSWAKVALLREGVEVDLTEGTVPAAGVAF